MSEPYNIKTALASGTKTCLLCGRTIKDGTVVHLTMQLKVFIASVEKKEEIHSYCARLFALDIHRLLDQVK